MIATISSANVELACEQTSEVNTEIAKLIKQLKGLPLNIRSNF